MADSVAAAPAKAQAFAALHNRDYRAYFGGSTLSMMGDNIEHVISYWVLFQTVPLAGAGGLRGDQPLGCRSLFSVCTPARWPTATTAASCIQCAHVLFMACRLAWGVLFLTDRLQMWHAMVLLSMHGLAGASGPRRAAHAARHRRAREPAERGAPQRDGPQPGLPGRACASAASDAAARAGGWASSPTSLMYLPMMHLAGAKAPYTGQVRDQARWPRAARLARSGHRDALRDVPGSRVPSCR